MSFTDNLVAFNTQMEQAIGEIPLEEVVNDPNIYRLIKLLSWSKQAAGATGGGGGSTSPIDIASGIDASSDIDSIIAELQTIAANSVGGGGGTDATTIASGINSASDIDTIIAELTAINSNTTGSSSITEAEVRSAIQTASNIGGVGNQLSTIRTDILSVINGLTLLRTARAPGNVTKDAVFDLSLTPNTPDNLFIKTGSYWISGISLSLSAPCKLEIVENTNTFFQIKDAQFIDKTYQFPKPSTGNITITTSETTDNIRVVCSIEYREQL